ncbi:hypothetical protein ACHAWF_006554 [Thalassiosira exigua]
MVAASVASLPVAAPAASDVAVSDDPFGHLCKLMGANLFLCDDLLVCTWDASAVECKLRGRGAGENGGGDGPPGVQGALHASGGERERPEEIMSTEDLWEMWTEASMRFEEETGRGICTAGGTVDDCNVLAFFECQWCTEYPKDWCEYQACPSVQGQHSFGATMTGKDADVHIA